MIISETFRSKGSSLLASGNPLLFKSTLLYLLILLIGTLLQQTHLLQFAADWYLIRPGNILNKTFAGYGYLFLGFILVSVTIVQVIETINDGGLLLSPILPLYHPNTSSNASDAIKDKRIYKTLMKRAIKFIVIYIDLNLILSYKFGFFNWVTRHTQHCSIIGIFNEEECLEQLDSIWYDGFDPSGHYFLLLTLSLTTLCELQLVFPSTRTPILKNVIIYSALSLLVIWLYLFTITSIFYHTIAEKITGFLFGSVITLIINITL